MDLTVEFNREPLLDAVKINDKRTDAVLPSKLAPVQLRVL